jgi:hypothetical protein
VKATAESEAGIMPTSELLETMGKYNAELVNAGILLAGEGLHPSRARSKLRRPYAVDLDRLVHGDDRRLPLGTICRVQGNRPRHQVWM